MHDVVFLIKISMSDRPESSPNNTLLLHYNNSRIHCIRGSVTLKSMGHESIVLKIAFKKIKIYVLEMWLVR